MGFFDNLVYHKTRGMDAALKRRLFERAIKLNYAKTYDYSSFCGRAYEWRLSKSNAFCFIPVRVDGEYARIEMPITGFFKDGKNKG
jgi:hypothetical protein